jgi:hypothetical protein
MAHHVKKPAVVERLTNQLQRNITNSNHILLDEKQQSALEDFGRTGWDVHEREKGEATLEACDN